MRTALRAMSQMAVMAAIVATMSYLPLGVVLALALRWAGMPLDVLLTLGGTVHAVLGLLLGWLLVFAGACGYAAWLFPWGDKIFGWPGGE
jgi:Na+/H+-dicarboxylate symporter